MFVSKTEKNEGRQVQTRRPFSFATSLPSGPYATTGSVRSSCPGIERHTFVSLVPA